MNKYKIKNTDYNYAFYPNGTKVLIRNLGTTERIEFCKKKQRFEVVAATKVLDNAR